MSVFLQFILSQLIKILPWDTIKDMIRRFIDNLTTQSCSAETANDLKGLHAYLDTAEDSGSTRSRITEWINTIIEQFEWEDVVPALDSLFDVIEDSYGPLVNFFVRIARERFNIPDLPDAMK